MARIQLCSVHGNNLLPSSCQPCSAVAHMVREQCREQLVVEPAASVPQAKDRLFAKRVNEAEPTLVLSEEEMSLLEAIHSQVRSCK